MGESDHSVLAKELLKEFQTLLKEEKFKEIKDLSDKHHAADIAEIMNEIEDPKDNIVLLRLFSTDLAAEIFTYLLPELQEDIVHHMTNSEIQELVSPILTDDVVDILEEMPANIVKKILRASTREDREKINQILKYDDDTAGSIMSVDFIKIRDHMTIKEAIGTIRKYKDQVDDFNICYVVDELNNLKGHVELKNLVLNDEKKIISEIMVKKIISVSTKTDQEDVAALFKKYDVNTLPIVNLQDKLVGIITVDDVIDVIEEETTEDIHKMAGIFPTEDAYFSTSIWKMFRSRILWLIILMLLATFTQIAICGFISLYGVNKKESSSPFYIITIMMTPLITVLSSVGGMASSQSSAMVVRAMALKEVKKKDFLNVLWKELRVAALCGLLLVVINVLRMILFNMAYDFNSAFDEKHIYLLIITNLAMYLTILMGKLIGGSLPIIAKAMKIDPALAASPLVTSITDVISTCAFFGIGLAFF